MSMIAEVEQIALGLPEAERGKLASKLIRSLSFLEKENESREILDRSKGLRDDPSIAISHDDFLKFFEDRSNG